MSRDLCVVAIRAFGFYPLYVAIVSITQSIWYLFMVPPDYPEGSQQALASTLPTVLLFLFSAFCIFFAPWIACRFYGSPENESESAENITLDRHGLLRVGIAVLALYVATEIVYPLAALFEYVLTRDTRGAIDHAVLVPTLTSLSCTALVSGILIFRAESIARALERTWSDPAAAESAAKADG